MRKEKAMVIALIGTMILLSQAFNILPTSAQKTNVISVKYQFDESEILNWLDTGQYMKNLRVQGVPGEPQVPYRTAKILLPPYTEVVDVSVQMKIGSKHSVKDIPCGQPPVVIGEEPKTVEKNPAIYGSNGLYPGEAYRVGSVNSFRGYNILHVRLYPVQYKPASKLATYYTEMIVYVTLKTGNRMDTFRNLVGDRKIVASLVDNPSTLSTYDSTLVTAETLGTTYEYIVVTTPNLADEFQVLADWKAHFVDGAKVVTVNVGANETEIKDVINDYYTNYDTSYVLLGGDVGVIPYHTKQVTVGITTAYIAEDYWYANLDGDDDISYYEVYIGRAPVDNEAEAKNFVKKVIAFERMAKPKANLFHQSRAGYGNIPDSRELAWQCEQYVPSDYTNYELFEDADPPQRIEKTDWINFWRNDGIMFEHMGHGSINSYYINLEVGGGPVTWYDTDVASMDNTFWPVHTSVACFSGAFKFEDCLAEAYVKDPDNGAIAALMNDKYGWYMPDDATMFSGDFIEMQFKALYQDGHQSIGAMLAYSKAEFIDEANNETDPDQPVWEWCYREINLIGDPETPLLTTRSAPLILNGGFETGVSSHWTTGGAGDHRVTSDDAYTGSYSMLIGYNYSDPVKDTMDWCYQTITIPATATNVRLLFYYHLFTEDCKPCDWFEVYVRNSTGHNLALVFEKSGVDYSGLEEYGWAQVAYDLTPYAGQTIQIYFAVANMRDELYKTWCYIDDVSVIYEIYRTSGTLIGTGDSYTFSIPSLVGTYTVVMMGNEKPDFDFNLYAKWNSPPTTTNYDAISNSTYSSEYFTVTGSGTLYIMVHSYYGKGNWRCNVVTGRPPIDGGRKVGQLTGTGAADTYSLAGEGYAWVYLSGPDTANFDLYIKWNSPPTTTDYDDRGITTWSQEICRATGSGTLHYMALSNRGAGEYTMLALIFYGAARDVAVTGVSYELPYGANAVYPTGWKANIPVNVKNKGGFTETFDITVYHDSAAIGTQTLSLSPRTETTINFTWNTTGVSPGNHLISAEASVVPGETDTTDNIYLDGIVTVKYPGDVDGDGDVDRYDLGFLANAYGSRYGDPRYDWRCDFDGDGDVDEYDYDTVATYFGSTWVHDVAVAGVSYELPYGANAVYPTGWKVNIPVNVKNEGDYVEIFNVTAYANTTIIDTKTVTGLAPGENTTLTFVWTVPTPPAWTPYPPHYVISAEADVVSGETDTSDNLFVDGSVTVKHPGDVDGDGDVDRYDLGFLANAYGSRYGDPRYDWRCDFDGDDYVDSIDHIILYENYGWKA